MASKRDKVPISMPMAESIIDRIADENREMREIYRIEKLIHNSANGFIYQGYRKVDGTPIIIKQVSKARTFHYTDYGGQKIPREFAMQLKASAITGVVQAMHVFERSTSYILTMDRPDNSIDLFEFSQKYGSMPEAPAKIVFGKIVQTCKDLAAINIFHRDIKDENILLDTFSLDTKIIDFGCAIECTSDKKFSTFSGTPEFAPPEVHRKSQYSPESSTVWTLAIVLSVLLFAEVPFCRNVDMLVGQRSNLDETNLTTSAIELLDGMLCPDPSQRFKLDDILDSDWLKNAITDESSAS